MGLTHVNQSGAEDLKPGAEIIRLRVQNDIHHDYLD